MTELMELFDGYERVWYSAEKRKKILAENMCFLRKKSDLSQKKLSEMLGISPQAYNGYEAGKYEPTIETLIRLCFLYNVDMDYLTGRWNSVDETRESETIIKNEAENDKADTISFKLYQLERRINAFNREHLTEQKRAKKTKDK